jgi:putative sterol carrier protein
LSWRSSAANALADAQVFIGDLKAAYRTRVEALEISKAAGNEYHIRIANLKLAIVLRQQGRLQQVKDICQKEIQLASDSRMSHPVAHGLLLAIWYALTGDGGGLYHLHIKDGECTAHRGPAANADLTINSPAEVWIAISRGELNGPQAYMGGKYQWSGDMRIMIIMDRLFNHTGSQEKPSSNNQSSNSKEDIPMIDKSTLNCHDIIAGMPKVFDAEAAGDLTADIQFDVSGEEPGSYYLHVEDGACTFNEGQSLSPALTIHTPSEV